MRWMSYVYAMSEAVDRAMLFANCVRANVFIINRCQQARSSA